MSVLIASATLAKFPNTPRTGAVSQVDIQSCSPEPRESAYTSRSFERILLHVWIVLVTIVESLPRDRVIRDNCQKNPCIARALRFDTLAFPAVSEN